MAINKKNRRRIRIRIVIIWRGSNGLASMWAKLVYLSLTESEWRNAQSKGERNDKKRAKYSELIKLSLSRPMRCNLILSASFSYINQPTNQHTHTHKLNRDSFIRSFVYLFYFKANFSFPLGSCCCQFQIQLESQLWVLVSELFEGTQSIASISLYLRARSLAQLTWVARSNSVY